MQWSISEVGPAAELERLLDAHRGERHVLALQNFPDPDAISSAMAHARIARRFGIECDILYDGTISHQENLALVKLIDVELTRWEPELDLGRYSHSVFIDNQGTTTTLTGKLEAAGVRVLAVVDHHDPQGVVKPDWSDIRPLGATATMYTQYIQAGLLTLDPDEEDDVQLATALMHGIRSETQGFLRAHEEEFRAAGFLSAYVDRQLLTAILNVRRSRRAMDIIDCGLRNRQVVENYSISGLGYMRYTDRDVIPQVAEFLLTEENVHTAVVYGVVVREEDREIVVGSLRTNKVTLSPDEFLKDAMGADANGRFYGGGRRDAGGFEIPIGFLSGSASLDDELGRLKWQLIDATVRAKVLEKIQRQT